MRIAFLATADNIHTRRWAEFLISRGHELFLLCDPPVKNPPKGARIIHPEMRLITKILAFKLFPKPYGNNFFKRFSYKRKLLQLKPDIVHGFEALGYGYALAMCGHFPKVLTPWGNDILFDPKKSKIARYLVKKALNKADAITTNFLELSDYLEKEFSVQKTKIHPFSWGVDLEIFHPGYEKEAIDLRESLEIPGDSKIILSNRMMKPYWGIETIARALPDFFQKTPNSYAIFIRGAGDIEFEKKIRQIIEKSGFTNRVRFVSEYLSVRKMAIYLNMADIFISCPNTDLLSISLLEGLSCGCSPVLSELDAYKKRVRHEQNGLFFKPGDHKDLSKKLITYYKHPEFNKQFAKINLEITREKDDWKKNALKLEDIYKSLIQKK
jgi:L-malate glycosyltransferase